VIQSDIIEGVATQKMLLFLQKLGKIIGRKSISWKKANI